MSQFYSITYKSNIYFQIKFIILQAKNTLSHKAQKIHIAVTITSMESLWQVRKLFLFGRILNYILRMIFHAKLPSRHRWRPCPLRDWPTPHPLQDLSWRLSVRAGDGLKAIRLARERSRPVWFFAAPTTDAPSRKSSSTVDSLTVRVKSLVVKLNLR